MHRAQRSGCPRSPGHALGKTGTFHSNSGPNAEAKETSPILGTVLNYSACETA